MRLKGITASACPEGNRIAISWTNPDPAGYPGVRVVRREKTYPVSPRDGVIVAEGTSLHTGFNAEGEALYTIIDSNLQGENHYYYTLFTYQGIPPVYAFDYHNRCVAMATSAYGFGAQMFALLPRIYHRYDTVLPTDPANIPAELGQAGQLRRFLEVPGSMLDLLYSHAGAAFHLHNTDRMDGRLLPLLAQWIAWQIDYRLEIDAQRNEIRNAPDLYKAVGLIPTVEATVKRLTNWESRVKEFVHNIFLSNNPERLNLWTLHFDEQGEWQQQESPFSLNFAYEGRPAAITDETGTIWLFYHTKKRTVVISGTNPGQLQTAGRRAARSPKARPLTSIPPPPSSRQALCGSSGIPITKRMAHGASNTCAEAADCGQRLQPSVRGRISADHPRQRWTAAADSGSSGWSWTAAAGR